MPGYRITKYDPVASNSSSSTAGPHALNDTIAMKSRLVMTARKAPAMPASNAPESHEAPKPQGRESSRTAVGRRSSASLKANGAAIAIAATESS